MSNKEPNKNPLFNVSDHCDGQRFFNPDKDIIKSFEDVKKMWKERPKTKNWPEQVILTETPRIVPEVDKNTALVTIINHATQLIQLNQLNIITDPVYANRVGPLGVVGPKRVHLPAISIEKLPKIDIVIISHNHYDHMDLNALSKLNKRFTPLFVVPLGNARYLHKKGIQHIKELDWWDTVALSNTQQITLTPAIHWSKRTLNDTNKALWGGFYIQSDALSIYFAGDTGYGEHFHHIRERCGNPYISILPIGSYEPQWFMQPQHLNPFEAAQAFCDLQSTHGIATHHQTFKLSYEGYDEPEMKLQEAISALNIPSGAFLAPKVGKTVEYEILV